MNWRACFRLFGLGKHDQNRYHSRKRYETAARRGEARMDDAHLTLPLVKGGRCCIDTTTVIFSQHLRDNGSLVSQDELTGLSTPLTCIQHGANESPPRTQRRMGRLLGALSEISHVKCSVAKHIFLFTHVFRSLEMKWKSAATSFLT